MTFILDSYEVRDESIDLLFVSPDPGPGAPGEYTVTIQDSELTGDPRTDIETITTKLQRKFKAPGLSDKLLVVAGWSIEV